MSKKKNIHAVQYPDGGWATRREGATRVSDLKKTRLEQAETALLVIMLKL